MQYTIEAVRPSSSAGVPFLPRLLMSLLALAFFAAGLGLFAYHVSILQTWQPVDATVVRSEVIEFRGKKQRKMFRGEVELAYTVGGRQYQTPDTFNHASSSQRSIRRKMATTYAVGTQHRVFYDPGNPHAIRWDVGVNLSFFLLPLVFSGVGLILIGVCFFLWRLPYPARLVCGRCGNAGRLGERYCPRCGDALAMIDHRGAQEPRAADSAQEEWQRDDGEGEEEFEIPPTEPMRENPLGLSLVGAFFLIPGLVCLAIAVYLGMTTYAALNNWPTAEAMVTSGVIEASRSGDGTPAYQLALEFEYAAPRQTQRAAGRSLYTSSSYAWIVRRLERFPVGSRHTVRVNPLDAADVRFDLDSPVLNWLPTAGLSLFGGIFAVIGGSLLLWGLRPRCQGCRHRLRRGGTFCPGCGTPVAAV